MLNMFTLLALATIWLSVPTAALPSLFRLTEYAPTAAECPPSGLARDAIGLSNGESSYRANRSKVADQHLRAWFTSVNKDMPADDKFDTNGAELPVIGLASSGGGFGSMLNNAGLVQAWDNRDSTEVRSRMKGFYQAITYHIGTSTGAWMLGALVGNEGATVSSLVADKWLNGFSDALFIPQVDHRAPTTYSSILLDAVAKSLSGYNPTLVDVWGRLASLHVLKAGLDHPVHLSSLVNRSDFQQSNLPYPIFTALNVDPRRNITGCNRADLSSPQYELHPFEFGSWDSGIRSFSQMAFMGSQSVAGFAPSSATCINGFDNLGFLMAASSNSFNNLCAVVPGSRRFTGALGDVWDDIIDMTSAIHGLSFLDEYAVVPGPFAATTNVDSLYLVDGGQGGESVPIWPLLPPERDVEVIVACDFSTPAPDQLPDGSSLYTTFVRAGQMGFTRLPTIPTPAEFKKWGLNTQPTFFGCDSGATQALVIYIPNRSHILGTNVGTWEIQFDSMTVNKMVQTGNLVATMKGDTQFPICVGCAVLSRSKGKIKLPEACKACWDRFCFKNKVSGPVD